MTRSFVYGVLATTIFAAASGAQTVSPSCPPGSSVGGIPDAQMASQDACQKAIDLFQFLAPQLGTVLAGGNATLGQAGTLGGLGHIMMSARANVLSGKIPQIDKVTPVATGATSSNYPVKTQVIGLPQIDAAIGLFKGIPLGVSNVGGLDLLVSAEYLPSVTSGSVNVDVPNGSLKLGFGGRLGLIQESIITPGVSVTYLRRDLPTANIRATTGNDSLRINGLEVRTKAWRIVANKSLLLFGLAVGAGRDNYTSKGNISAYVAPRIGGNPTAVSAGPIPLEQNLTRTNYFADLSINLFLLKIIGEVGRVSGGTVNTYNTFSGNRADDARTYGTIGLRFGR